MVWRERVHVIAVAGMAILCIVQAAVTQSAFSKVVSAFGAIIGTINLAWIATRPRK
jgi:hypothetical protein